MILTVSSACLITPADRTYDSTSYCIMSIHHRPQLALHATPHLAFVAHCSLLRTLPTPAPRHVGFCYTLAAQHFMDRTLRGLRTQTNG